MKSDDEVDAEIAQMFDEVTEVHVSPDGEAESKRTSLDEALKGGASDSRIVKAIQEEALR